MFQKGDSVSSKLCVFVDADFGNDNLDRKNVTGYMLSLFRNCIIWRSKKQNVYQRVLKGLILRLTAAARGAIKHCARNTETAKHLAHDFMNGLYHVFGEQENYHNYFCKKDENCGKLLLLRKCPELSHKKTIETKIHHHEAYPLALTTQPVSEVASQLGDREKERSQPIACSIARSWEQDNTSSPSQFLASTECLQELTGLIYRLAEWWGAFPAVRGMCFCDGDGPQMERCQCRGEHTLGVPTHTSAERLCIVWVSFAYTSTQTQAESPSVSLTAFRKAEAPSFSPASSAGWRVARQQPTLTADEWYRCCS
ncbi:hypothetical protein PR048_016521 [Dryococelus australis]|uniref:Uncharacterized protein n=1 Tax=Dryococelus australis TaxID=614101 RepID=A0ABQ9HL62_9NEOP|nr:hypothetical protein PR048_016521 [Dryococelus australis]